MLVRPEAGLVVNYDFLWKDEEDRGRTKGKDRPCMIVATHEVGGLDGCYVYILPITHAPPNPREPGIEIPHSVASRLGLDGERMWIKTREVNRVEWPEGGYPFGVTANRRGQMSYGVMRRDIAEQAYQQVDEQYRNGKVVEINRDEEI